MLQVWLRAQHSSLAVWHNNQWQIVDGWQQLHDTYINANSGSYRASSSNKTLCLYFPTSHMLQVDTQLTSAQLKQLGDTGRQYLFEEVSLTPIEQLSIKQTNQTNTSYLYALAQYDIETWQQSAALAGLSIAALLPDFLLLPIPEEGAGQQVVLYQDADTTLLRQTQYQGLAVSYLPLLFERLPQLSEVCSLPAIGDISSEIAGNNNVTVETATLISDQQLLLTPLAISPKPIDYPERHTLNFFIKTSSTKLSPYLRITMMVALSALVLQMMADGLQWYRYDAATSATEQAIATQYQSWFVDERLNPRTGLEAQMRDKLRTSAQTPPSMAALARISSLIKQSSLQAQALTVQPNALSFTIIAADRDSLDQFANTLNEQGLSASLQRVNSREQGQVSGQITVNIANDAVNDVANNQPANRLTADS
ncbi:MAG: type II secretion system protein GspL [Psychrobacter sp.]|nr:type II secretion system protein GspL [Psychrobacter sp.]